MRSVCISTFGGPDVLHVVESEPPIGKETQVRVDVKMASLNWLDIAVRRGARGPGIRRPQDFPHVMGADASGTIGHIGAKAQTHLRVGDPVVIYPGLSCGDCHHCVAGETSRCPCFTLMGEDIGGVQQDSLWVDPRNVAPVPDGLDLASAAAIPVAYTTAWNLVVNAGEITVGDRVLVVGASGGVAVSAIQLAVVAGADVWAATREPSTHAKLLEQLGVSEVFNSSDAGWGDRVHSRSSGGVNLVVDPVGSATWRDSIHALRPGGLLAVCGASSGDEPHISIRELYQHHRRIVGAPLGGLRSFRDVLSALSTHGMRPIVSRIGPLEDIREMHREMEASKIVGKAVIEVGA